MNVWVTGAAGMLGSEVVASLRNAGLTVTATDREVDITQEQAVAEHLDTIALPAWIINCAAWTAVDAAEYNERDAFALNGRAPKILAQAAARHGARLLHVSTDYVFDGNASVPYTPDAQPAPCSVYGRSKLAGELAIRDMLTQHVIIRTAWLYGHHGSSFVGTMLRLMLERDEISVVADQRGTPTCAADLAAAIGTVVTSSTDLAGTWHYSNKGATNWYEFANTIQEIGLKTDFLDRKCRIVPITTAQYPTQATRPAYSVLDTTSFERDWHVSIQYWRESFERYLRSLQSYG